MIDKVYQLIKVNQAQFPMLVLCETLGVSRSGYYDWINRIPSQRAIANAKLTEQIMAIHRMSDFTYGRPRITAELADLGIMANHKRVGRLMRLAKIKGVSRRRGFVITTHRNRHNRRAPDLVQRHFKATNINQLWVADMTYSAPILRRYLLLILTKLEHVWNVFWPSEVVMNRMPVFCYEKA
ncbi:MAG: IS3 family transposase [Nitrosomonas sp.]